MSKENFVSRLISKASRNFLSLKEIKNFYIGSPKKILIVRQHNQFGDLLASVPLFRAVKETFPQSKITVIVSPQNYYAVVKNNYIDEVLLFDKKKLLNIFYVKQFLKKIRSRFDVCIMPATVSLSYTSGLICRLSNSKIRIGPSSLNGKKNPFDYFFDRKVVLNWAKHPDAHVSDFELELVRPFGINTNSFRTTINFNENDTGKVDEFISLLKLKRNQKLIGLHIGAGKSNNRWAVEKFVELIHQLNGEFDSKFYITGSKKDKNEINYFKKKITIEIAYFLDRKISELTGLISKSDLFITNDTGVMHVAGSTDTPQVSIFGPTNPFNWAPIGSQKYFIKKSDFIDDVSVNDVFDLCKIILTNKKQTNKNYD